MTLAATLAKSRPATHPILVLLANVYMSFVKRLETRNFGNLTERARERGEPARLATCQRTWTSYECSRRNAALHRHRTQPRRHLTRQRAIEPSAAHLGRVKALNRRGRPVRAARDVAGLRTTAW
jgi:hypothetical protein